MGGYRGIIVVVIMLACAPIQGNASSQAKRVVSINLCTDELLLSLAERHQILSVSFLSTQPEYSYYWDQLDGISINRGLAEEILPLKPDLVLAGKYTTVAAVNFLRAFGLNVEQIEIPQDFAGVYSSIRKVGELIGAEKKAKVIISEMKLKMDNIRKRTAGQPTLQAAILAPNNFTSGINTFKSKLIEAAGFENIAGRYGIDWYGTLSLEHIVESQPDVLIIDNSTANKNSLADRLLQHPALRRGMLNTKILDMPPALWACGGPITVKALDILESYHAK
ncbi:MAG: ABC transporter substrate-binding protein [Pseudomonadales bacterium]|nr:ABC transporter substrate-binding protein [Pseudomonadales bacterium]